MNFDKAMKLPDNSTTGGDSKEGVKGILKALYEEALKKGRSGTKEIEELDAYKSIKYHTDKGLFAKAGTKKSKDGQDKEDTYDKGTLLAMVRDREIELDKMKRLQGYRGSRKVTTDEQYRNPEKSQPGGSDYVEPRRQPVPTFKAKAGEPFDFISNHDFTKPQTDAFGKPLQPVVPKTHAFTPDKQPDLLKLDQSMAQSMLANKVPDDPYANPAPKEAPSYVKNKEDFEQTLNKTIPIVQKQRETILNSKKLLEKAYVDQINATSDEKVKQQIQKSYSSQTKMLDDNLSMLNKYKGVEAVHGFNTNLESVYSRAVGRDKDGNAIIPNQTSNWNNVTQSFNGTLKAIIDHEKEQGNLSSDVDNQSVLDHVLSGRSMYHSMRSWFTDDEYDKLHDKYSPFFDKYKEGTNNIRTLHNQYLSEGGVEAERKVPVADNSSQLSGDGTRELSGVVLPKDRLKWSDGTPQIFSDVIQGATEQVFNPAGKLVSAFTTLLGGSYQTGESIEQGFNIGGSRFGRAIGDVVNFATDPVHTIMNSPSPMKHVVDLVSGAWGDPSGHYVSPTMSAVSGAIKGTAITAEQKQLSEETDSPTRDIVQATTDLVSGMSFGDFNAAGKLATAGGEAVMFSKNLATGAYDLARGRGIAVGLAQKTAEGYNDAVTITNRIAEGLEKMPVAGKGLAGLADGTQKGRTAMLLVKSMLPVGADMKQAAHLATTMAIQHVAQHADNMTDDDIVDGIRTGTLFGLFNVGFSKLFGGVAQRLAVNAKSSGALSVGELAEKAERYKRIATVLGQIATQPAQSHVSEAMSTGDWSKVFNPDDYMNRQTIIDMLMGGLDIKGIMHGMGSSKEHAKQLTDLYDATVKRMAFMEDKDGAVADYHELMGIFGEQALVHVPKVPSFVRAYAQVPPPIEEQKLLPSPGNPTVPTRAFEAPVLEVPKPILELPAHTDTRLEEITSQLQSLTEQQLALQAAPDKTVKDLAVEKVGYLRSYATITERIGALDELQRDGLYTEKHEQERGRLENLRELALIEAKKRTDVIEATKAEQGFVGHRSKIDGRLKRQTGMFDVIPPKKLEEYNATLRAEKEADIESQKRSLEIQKDNVETEVEYAEAIDKKVDGTIWRAKTARLLRERTESVAVHQVTHEAVRDKSQGEVQKTKKQELAEAKKQLADQRAKEEEARKFREAEVVLNENGELVTKAQYVADEKAKRNQEREDAAPKTEFGTPIVEPITAGQSVVDVLEAQQVPTEKEDNGNVTVEAKHVVAALKPIMATDDFRGKVVAIYEKLIGKDTKVVFTTQPTANKKAVPGAYHEGTDTAYLKHRDEEGNFDDVNTAMHEIHHAVFDQRLKDDANFRLETETIRKLAMADEEKAFETIYDHVQRNNPERPEEEIAARVADIMKYHLGGDLNEFGTGAVDGNTGIATLLRNTVVPGEKLSLWDKFKNLFMSKGKKKLSTADRNLLSMYYDSLVDTAKKVPITSKPTGTQESGSLAHTMWAVTGKKVAPEDLTEENIPYFRVIDDYFNSKKYPEAELSRAVRAVKGLEPIAQEYKDDAVADGMIRKAQAYANKKGLSYDEMSPIEKSVALANSILDGTKRDVLKDATALHNVFLNDIRKIANEEYPDIHIDAGNSATQMLMAVRSIHSTKQAGRELRAAIELGAEGYLKRMDELYQEIAAVDSSPETKAAWEKSKGDLWRIAHNTVDVIPLRMNIRTIEEENPDTGQKILKPVYSLSEVKQETTSQGKVERYRQQFGGLASFAKSMKKDASTKAWAKSPAAQMLLESLADTGTTYSIHETLSDSDLDVKGMNAPHPGALVAMQEKLLKGGSEIGKDGKRFALIMSGGSPIIMDVTNLARYILSDKEMVAERLNELHDANVWRMLDSHLLHNDGATSTRYGHLPLMFDATKIHQLMNIDGIALKDLSFEQLTKDSFRKRIAPERYLKAKEAFDKEKLTGHQLTEIAPLIDKLHRGIDGKRFEPFALRTQGNLLSGVVWRGEGAKKKLKEATDKFEAAKSNIDKDPARQQKKMELAQKEVSMATAEFNKAKESYHKQKAATDEKVQKEQYAELLTQINAFLHWAVDPAGAQYLGHGAKALPKIGEKYFGVVSAPYQSYKTWRDITIGARHDWADKSDEDLLNLHAIHTREDGTKFIKWAVVDADLFPAGHLDEFKELFGKSGTDGSLVVFHEGNMDFLRQASGKDDAGHVKTALAAYDNGMATINKGDTHFYNIERIKELGAKHPHLAQVAQRFIDIADNLKRENVFGIAFSTTLKSKGTYTPKAEGELLLDNQRKVIGLQQGDGTYKLDKEKADQMNVEAQTKILTGQGIDTFSILDMDLHGDNAIQFVSSSASNDRTESPSLGVKDLARVIQSAWGDAVKPHFDAFFDNKFTEVDDIITGYNGVDLLAKDPKGTLSDSDSKKAGSFLKQLARYVEAREENAYSGVSEHRRMSDDLHKAVDAYGKVIPENVAKLMMHPGLFYKRPSEGYDAEADRSMVDAMVADKAKRLRYGRDKGMTATVNADLTGMLDHQYMIDYLKEKGKDMAIGADGIPRSLDEASLGYIQTEFNEFGTYADNSQGVTISISDFEKLSAESVKNGTGELTLGSPIFLVTTPYDDISSFAPFRIMGLTDTANTISANKKYILSYTGKDFDGDVVGMFINSKAWQSNGTDHFNELHRKLTAMGVHKGIEKGEQGKVIDGAIKFSDTGVPESRVQLADGSYARTTKPPISPLHPGHNEMLAQTTRNVGVTVKQLEDISQAIQNTFGKWEVKDLGVPEFTYHGIRMVYNEKLMDNNSIIKQLGAVDMYVPHGFNMEDIIYGTYVYSYKEFDRKANKFVENKWSEISTYEKRKKAMGLFNEFVKDASGKTIKSIMAGEKPNAERLKAHKQIIHEPVSTDARMLDLALDRFPGGYKESQVYDQVTKGIAELQGSEELAPYYAKAKVVMDKVAGFMKLLFNKPNEENHKTTNYFKEMVPAYFDKKNADEVQDKEVQIAMLTQYYHGIQGADDVATPITQLRKQEIPNDIREKMSPENIKRIESQYSTVSLSTDKRGAKLTDGTSSFYIREVVKKDGTLLPEFLEFLDKNGVTPNILFHKEVKGAFKIPALSLTDADFIKGAVYGNLGQHMERTSGGVTNAGRFVGFALTAPMKEITNSKVGGSYINHQGDNMLKSDPLQIIAGVESTGVVPITPSLIADREKLRDYLTESVQSQAFGQRESGSLDFSVWRKGAVQEVSDHIGELENLDIRTDEGLRRSIKVVQDTMEKQYGKRLSGDDMKEMMGMLDETQFRQMMEQAKVSGTEKEAQQNFVTAFIQLDNSIREHIKTKDIQKYGGVKEAMYEFFAKNSMFDVDDSNRVIEKLDPNQVGIMAHEVAAPLVSIVNGVAKVSEIFFGDIFKDRLQANMMRFTSSAYKNYIAPRVSMGQGLDMHSNNLNTYGEVSRLIGSKGDHMKMLKAVIRGLVPDINYDWNSESNGVASSRVDGTVYFGDKNNPLMVLNIGTSRTDIFEQLDKIDKLPIGKTIGATFAKVKYGRNYTAETDTSLRNTFITEVDPEGGLWNATSEMNDIVAGKAFSQARDRAMMEGTDLNLFDIGSQTWYRLLKGEKLVPLTDAGGGKRVDIQSFDPNAFAEGNVHITSKLENHQLLSQMDENGVYPHHEVVDKLLRDNGAVLPTHERTEGTEEAFITEPFASTPEDQQAIRDAIKQHIYAAMIAKSHEMAEVTKLEHYKFALNSNADAPEHVEKILLDKIEQTQREINKHSGMDMTGIVSSMSRVANDKGVEAISTLKKVMIEMDADSMNADKLIRALYDDIDEGAGRTEMLQRKKELMSIMSHIVGKLEDSEGIARTIDLYKTDNAFKGTKGATFGEAEIFHALGKEDLLSINTANMIDRYQGSLKDAHATMDHVYQELYSQHKSPNKTAHANITKMLNVSLKGGALPSASHDVAVMNRDVRDAMQTKEIYHALDPGTNVTVQALNNQQEAQLIRGNYVGDVRLKITNEQGEVTGYQPTMIVANGNRITFINRDNLQSLKSAVHTIDNGLTRNFIKDWARSAEMKDFLGGIVEKHTIVESVADSSYGRFTKRSIGGDIKQEAFNAVKTIHELDENKAKLLDHLYSAGAFWQSAAGYLHLEAAATLLARTPQLFLNPVGFLNTLGYQVSRWATPVVQNYFGWDGLYKGRSDDMNPLGIIKGYIRGHKLDEEGERRLSFYNVGKKENISSKDIEAASAAHKARLDQLSGGGGFMELVGSTPEQVAALRDIQGNKDNTNASFLRWGKGAWLENRMRKLQGKLQEQFNPYDVFMPGVMDMTKEVSQDLLKDFKKHNMTIHLVDGQVKVLAEGKNVDEVASLRLSALTALTAASTLYILQATEKSGSDRAATFNAGTVNTFTNDYGDWSEAKRANYQRAALNYSQGNYSGKNADQGSGLGRTMAIYKTYGQERKVDGLRGVAERYQHKATAQAMFGKEAGTNMSASGIKLPDPNKQLMSILFRGLAGAALNEIFAKMVGIGGMLKPLTTSGKYMMGDSHVLPEFMAQLYNIYQVASGKDIMGNDRNEKDSDSKVIGDAISSTLRTTVGGYGISNVISATGAGVNYLADENKNDNFVEHATAIAKPLAGMTPLTAAGAAIPKVGLKVKEAIEREEE